MLDVPIESALVDRLVPPHCPSLRPKGPVEGDSDVTILVRVDQEMSAMDSGAPSPVLGESLFHTTAY